MAADEEKLQIASNGAMTSRPSKASRASASARATKTKPSAAAWDTSIQFLKGVGEKVASLLARGDVHSLWDLLLFMPRSYEDRRKLFTIDEMIEAAMTHQTVMGRGTIES